MGPVKEQPLLGVENGRHEKHRQKWGRRLITRGPRNRAHQEIKAQPKSFAPTKGGATEEELKSHPQNLERW